MNAQTEIDQLSAALADEPTPELLEAGFRNRQWPMPLRRRALEALADAHPERIVELIAVATDDPDLRREIPWAWIAFRNHVALPLSLCLRGFDHDNSASMRSLAGRLALAHGDEGLEAVTELLRDGDIDQRATAALALAPRAEPEVAEVLYHELTQRRPDRKWARTVGWALIRHYADRLLAWADRDQPDLTDRPQLAWALARTRMATGCATFEDAARHGPTAARKAALRQLATDTPELALPLLRLALREGKPKPVARLAFRQMRRLREIARPVATAMLDSEYWGERKAAVCLLRHWGELTPEQRERALADPHIAVRHAAVWRPRPDGATS